MVTAVAKKVLVVEDDKDILQLVKMYLDNEGFRTITAANGAEALKQVKSEHPDLVVLDLMLPEIDGLEVCKKLRVTPQTAMLPIIMLTAKSEESDTVVGLELGADDYVGKPFSPRALMARIKALFRRLERSDDQEISTYRYGILQLNPSRHEVTVDGDEVVLTAKEFGLLEHPIKESRPSTHKGRAAEQCVGLRLPRNNQDGGCACASHQTKAAYAQQCDLVCQNFGL